MNKPVPPNRREALAQMAALPFAFQLNAAANSYSTQYPDMLLEWLARLTNEIAAKWDEVRSRIRTPQELEQRNRFVREKFASMIHLYPQRTPLNPVRVRTLERDGYRVESVMFQSRPNFWVTASLYIPTSGPGPFPGIISPCGHSSNGRLYRAYQFTYQDLAKNGFVVLAYDPIGQGERRQYWNPYTGRAEFAGPITWEHSLPGQLLLLLGEDLTHYRVWDGMRAVDYLLTRPEVDPERIGCTGQSGGGTLTLFISAIDERIRCAAVHEGGTHHRWPFRLRPETRVETGDTEQHYFPGAIYGIDLCDLHVAVAPRPLMATIENFGPAFDETAAHIRARYRLLGMEDRFSAVEATDPHSMSPKLRLATVDWFSRWFYDRKGPEKEEGLTVEPAENLYCTPNGSVRYAQQGDTIFSLILKTQAALPPARKLPENAGELEAYRRQIRSEIGKLLRYQPSSASLGVRHLVTTPRTGYRIEKLEFVSEPGIYVPTWVFVPDRYDPKQAAMLYVDEAGKQAQGMEFGLLESLARKGQLLAAVDVRGVGETRPPHPGEESYGEFAHVDDIETVMSYMAWEIDRSLFGMRVQDVLRSVEYVLSRPDVDRSKIHLTGKGMGALWALYAAALDGRIASVRCEKGLLSYRALTRVDRYLHNANVFIPSVLRHFDLPQVAAAVADRELTLVSPVDAMKKPVDLALAGHEYAWTAAVYERAGARERFRVLPANSS